MDKSTSDKIYRCTGVNIHSVSKCHIPYKLIYYLLQVLISGRTQLTFPCKPETDLFLLRNNDIHSPVIIPLYCTFIIDSEVGRVTLLRDGL